MDLIALLGLIYIVGLIVVPVLIRLLPGLNKYLHENINAPNPAVMATVMWPPMIIVLSIYHIYKLSISTINWMSGNGFITKSNKDYRRLADYKYL